MTTETRHIRNNPNNNLISDTIIPLYERLASLSALFGQLLPCLQAARESMTATPMLTQKAFSSLREASNMLYSLCLEGNKFINKTTSSRGRTPFDPISEAADIWTAKAGDLH